MRYPKVILTPRSDKDKEYVDKCRSLTGFNGHWKVLEQQNTWLFVRPMADDFLQTGCLAKWVSMGTADSFVISPVLQTR